MSRKLRVTAALPLRLARRSPPCRPPLPVQTLSLQKRRLRERRLQQRRLRERRLQQRRLRQRAQQP